MFHPAGLEKGREKKERRGEEYTLEIPRLGKKGDAAAASLD